MRVCVVPRFVLGVVLVGSVLPGEIAWGAVTLTGNVVGDPATAPKDPCPLHGEPNHCGSVLDPSTVTLISSPTSTFQSTLAAQYPGSAWRFHYMGANDNLKGTFNVDMYGAYNICPEQYGLGAKIKVTFTPTTDSLIQDVLWISMYSQKTPTKTSKEIDDRAHLPVDKQPNTLYGPFYPYQDEDEEPPHWQSNKTYDYFYDAPGDSCPSPPFVGHVKFETYAAWWDDYFAADGSIVDRDGDGFHDVYIHEGFSWGYDFYCVPEPTTGMILGLGAMMLIRRRGGRA